MNNCPLFSLSWSGRPDKGHIICPIKPDVPKTPDFEVENDEDFFWLSLLTPTAFE